MFNNISLSLEDVSTLETLRYQHSKSECELSLIERWSIPDLLSRDITQELPPTFEEMLPLWVGNKALELTSKSRVEAYKHSIDKKLYLPNLDLILQELDRVHSGIPEWVISSVYSLALLNTIISKLEPRNSYHIVEVGGGHGLLAAYALRYLPEKIRYTLVDAIPESLVYANVFLRERFGDEVNFLMQEKVEFKKEAVINIIPAWKVNGQSIQGDIVINISSMQEMVQETVDAYLKIFDDWLVTGGGLIFANSRDFFYPREYDFPGNYKRLFMSYSPRSRTLDFPIEMFEKTSTSCRFHNAKMEQLYFRALKKRALKQIVSCKRELTQTRTRLNIRIKELTNQRDKLLELNSKLRNQNRLK